MKKWFHILSSLIITTSPVLATITCSQEKQKKTTRSSDQENKEDKSPAKDLPNPQKRSINFAKLYRKNFTPNYKIQKLKNLLDLPIENDKINLETLKDWEIKIPQPPVNIQIELNIVNIFPSLGRIALNVDIKDKNNNSENEQITISGFKKISQKEFQIKKVKVNLQSISRFASWEIKENVLQEVSQLLQNFFTNGLTNINQANLKTIAKISKMEKPWLSVLKFILNPTNFIALNYEGLNKVLGSSNIIYVIQDILQENSFLANKNINPKIIYGLLKGFNNYQELKNILLDDLNINDHAEKSLANQVLDFLVEKIYHEVPILQKGIVLANSQDWYKSISFDWISLINSIKSFFDSQEKNYLNDLIFVIKQIQDLKNWKRGNSNYLQIISNILATIFNHGIEKLEEAEIKILLRLSNLKIQNFTNENINWKAVFEKSHQYEFKIINLIKLMSKYKEEIKAIVHEGIRKKLDLKIIPALSKIISVLYIDEEIKNKKTYLELIIQEVLKVFRQLIFTPGKMLETENFKSLRMISEISQISKNQKIELSNIDLPQWGQKITRETLDQWNIKYPNFSKNIMHNFVVSDVNYTQGKITLSDKIVYQNKAYNYSLQISGFNPEIAKKDDHLEVENLIEGVLKISKTNYNQKLIQDLKTTLFKTVESGFTNWKETDLTLISQLTNTNLTNKKLLIELLNNPQIFSLFWKGPKLLSEIKAQDFASLTKFLPSFWKKIFTRENTKYLLFGFNNYHQLKLTIINILSDLEIWAKIPTQYQKMANYIVQAFAERIFKQVPIIKKGLTNASFHDWKISIMYDWNEIIELVTTLENLPVENHIKKIITTYQTASKEKKLDPIIKLIVKFFQKSLSDFSAKDLETLITYAQNNQTLFNEEQIKKIIKIKDIFHNPAHQQIFQTLKKHKKALIDFQKYGLNHLNYQGSINLLTNLILSMTNKKELANEKSLFASLIKKILSNIRNAVLVRNSRPRFQLILNEKQAPHHLPKILFEQKLLSNLPLPKIGTIYSNQNLKGLNIKLPQDVDNQKNDWEVIDCDEFTGTAWLRSKFKSNQKNIENLNITIKISGFKQKNKQQIQFENIQNLVKIIIQKFKINLDQKYLNWLPIIINKILLDQKLNLPVSFWEELKNKLLIPNFWIKIFKEIAENKLFSALFFSGLKKDDLEKNANLKNVLTSFLPAQLNQVITPDFLSKILYGFPDEVTFSNAIFSIINKYKANEDILKKEVLTLFITEIIAKSLYQKLDILKFGIVNCNVEQLKAFLNYDWQKWISLLTNYFKVPPAKLRGFQKIINYFNEFKKKPHFLNILIALKSTLKLGLINIPQEQLSFLITLIINLINNQGNLSNQKEQDIKFKNLHHQILTFLKEQKIIGYFNNFCQDKLFPANKEQASKKQEKKANNQLWQLIFKQLFPLTNSLNQSLQLPNQKSSQAISESQIINKFKVKNILKFNHWRPNLEIPRQELVRLNLDIPNLKQHLNENKYYVDKIDKFNNKIVIRRERRATSKKNKNQPEKHYIELENVNFNKKKIFINIASSFLKLANLKINNSQKIIEVIYQLLKDGLANISIKSLEKLFNLFGLNQNLIQSFQRLIESNLLGTFVNQGFSNEMPYHQLQALTKFVQIILPTPARIFFSQSNIYQFLYGFKNQEQFNHNLLHLFIESLQWEKLNESQKETINQTINHIIYPLLTKIPLLKKGIINASTQDWINLINYDWQKIWGSLSSIPLLKKWTSKYHDTWNVFYHKIIELQKKPNLSNLVSSWVLVLKNGLKGLNSQQLNNLSQLLGIFTNEKNNLQNNLTYRSLLILQQYNSFENFLTKGLSQETIFELKNLLIAILEIFNNQKNDQKTKTLLNSLVSETINKIALLIPNKNNYFLATQKDKNYLTTDLEKFTNKYCLQKISQKLPIPSLGTFVEEKYLRKLKIIFPQTTPLIKRKYLIIANDHLKGEIKIKILLQNYKTKAQAFKIMRLGGFAKVEKIANNRQKFSHLLKGIIAFSNGKIDEKNIEQIADFTYHILQKGFVNINKHQVQKFLKAFNLTEELANLIIAAKENNLLKNLLIEGFENVEFAKIKNKFTTIWEMLKLFSPVPIEALASNQTLKGILYGWKEYEHFNQDVITMIEKSGVWDDYNWFERLGLPFKKLGISTGLLVLYNFAKIFEHGILNADGAVWRQTITLRGTISSWSKLMNIFHFIPQFKKYINSDEPNPWTAFEKYQYIFSEIEKFDRSDQVGIKYVCQAISKIFQKGLKSLTKKEVKHFTNLIWWIINTTKKNHFPLSQKILDQENEQNIFYLSLKIISENSQFIFNLLQNGFHANEFTRNVENLGKIISTIISNKENPLLESSDFFTELISNSLKRLREIVKVDK